jgi:hypothetical protein
LPACRRTWIDLHPEGIHEVGQIGKIKTKALTFRTAPDVNGFEPALFDVFAQRPLADAEPLSRRCGRQKHRACNPG